MEHWGGSGTLHSLGTVNASMLLTHSERHSAMLQSMLHRTPKTNIACTSMLAKMHWARRSPMCKIRQRGYWVISAVYYTMLWRDTLHTTQNYSASETNYYTGNSTYKELSSQFWYTRTMRPCGPCDHALDPQATTPHRASDAYLVCPTECRLGDQALAGCRA